MGFRYYRKVFVIGTWCLRVDASWDTDRLLYAHLRTSYMYGEFEISAVLPALAVSLRVYRELGPGVPVGGPTNA